MNIEILPARLANQIAAGEVVERPASVVKELVENSLDANATSIKITIEKGGAKRIHISDNGSGIYKEELTLALSRHATSKIKNLHDLEGINSLGFRGEALASISSVSRLSLTSKPQDQETAWQASAQGRDMAVEVTPAAHTNGTTIDVMDLFFNTPARRKFMRTEKTEFTHIEEVIKRIALARFDVAFTLVHNDKVVRQYRIATTSAQKAKRVAQVCGQSFIDNALEVDCQHDGLTLQGWIAKPSYSRKQNDLCYSYVNGRMMRDKLINHAIRQSYNEMLLPDTYPAFVLFLSLDVRDVDVNVHPAKHEVRFHQGRYVHDFIYSVCHQALVDTIQKAEGETQTALSQSDSVSYPDSHALNQASAEVQEYVAPLQYTAKTYHHSDQGTTNGVYAKQSNRVSQQAASAYQQLMTPVNSNEAGINEDAQSQKREPATLLNTLGSVNIPMQFIAPKFALYIEEEQPRLISLVSFERYLNEQRLEPQWQSGLTSQPLLLPIKLTLTNEDIVFIENNDKQFNLFGMIVQRLTKTAVQIRQYPAVLRSKDVSESFSTFLNNLQRISSKQTLTEQLWQQEFLQLLSSGTYSQERLNELYAMLIQQPDSIINQALALNSKPIDLTSTIELFD